MIDCSNMAAPRLPLFSSFQTVKRAIETGSTTEFVIAMMAIPDELFPHVYRMVNMITDFPTSEMRDAVFQTTFSMLSDEQKHRSISTAFHLQNHIYLCSILPMLVVYLPDMYELARSMFDTVTMSDDCRNALLLSFRECEDLKYIAPLDDVSDSESQTS